MNQFPVLNFEDFISASGDTLTTDTLKVAAVHKKSHDNVLKLVRRRVSEAGGWGLVNFNETSYSDSQGRPQPMFTMTKDGYVFLVGRMTGKKAVEHQIAYIQAFNAMAAYIKNKREGLQYQFFQKELAYTTRKKGVSASARDMRAWQDDRPEMLEELNGLLVKMQPSLLPN
jgi:Rha family phage regulatory protein